MKVRNRPACITDREIQFVRAFSPETEHTPWGQFERIERAREDQARRHGWQQIIDHRLIDWGHHPEAIADDGLEPPTARAITVASEVACMLRDEGIAVPTHVAPNGDGGVVFHFQKANVFETIEVDEAGQYEWRLLRDGQLIHRSSTAD